MITRIVKAKLKPENLDVFIAFMHEFVAQAKQFQNIHHVDFFADNDDPLNFHIYTIWKTESALNKFRKSDTNLIFKQNLNNWCSAQYSAWTIENIF